MSDQEPFGWLYESRAGVRVFHPASDDKRFQADWEAAQQHPEAHKMTPLYTAPPQRNTLPLSADEIKCIKPICADFVSFRAGVRHAEREHGIGGEHD